MEENVKSIGENMKSIEDIYQKKWASHDPEHYKHIKVELIGAINNNRENLNAYKMVCESYGILNVNVVVATFILSLAGFIFSLLPKELVNKNLADYLGIIEFFSILAIIYIAYNAITMINKEKKCKQILSVLKDIEKDIFTDKVI